MGVGRREWRKGEGELVSGSVANEVLTEKMTERDDLKKVGERGRCFMDPRRKPICLLKVP